MTNANSSASGQCLNISTIIIESGPTTSTLKFNLRSVPSLPKHKKILNYLRGFWQSERTAVSWYLRIITKRSGKTGFARQGLKVLVFMIMGRRFICWKNTIEVVKNQARSIPRFASPHVYCLGWVPQTSKINWCVQSAIITDWVHLERVGKSVAGLRLCLNKTFNDVTLFIINGARDCSTDWGQCG